MNILLRVVNLVLFINLLVLLDGLNITFFGMNVLVGVYIRRLMENQDYRLVGMAIVS